MGGAFSQGDDWYDHDLGLVHGSLDLSERERTEDMNLPRAESQMAGGICNRTSPSHGDRRPYWLAWSLQLFHPTLELMKNPVAAYLPALTENALKDPVKRSDFPRHATGSDHLSCVQTQNTSVYGPVGLQPCVCCVNGTSRSE